MSRQVTLFPRFRARRVHRAGSAIGFATPSPRLQANPHDHPSYPLGEPVFKTCEESPATGSTKTAAWQAEKWYTSKNSSPLSARK